MNDIVCISPVDGSEVARRPIATDAEIVTVLEQARQAQQEWSTVPLAERKAKMLAFLDVMRLQNGEVVPELAMQMGRPVRYGGELRSLEERVRGLVELSDDALAPVVPTERSGFRRMVKRVPAGIVLVIAPWNYPYLTAVNAIVPALLAGNAVILKHAAQTLLVGERFQSAMDRIGLPTGLFRTLTLDHAATERLISSRSVNHVNFTGSVGGGRAVERAAAGTFVSLGLELGGKDPAYVRPDADFDFSVEQLVDGAFYNSGQCCCGIERVYVHEQIYGRFVDAFADLTSRYQLGNPLSQETTLGPMAAIRFADTVRAHIDEAISRNARPLIDPKQFSADRTGTAYLMPQVLIDVDHSMRVMMEESFGPVVGIMRVSSDQEAVSLMNDSPYGLTASIWTEDAVATELIGDAIATGTVFMNRCDYVDPSLAWTGVKDTGRGAGMSRFGFEALTRPKSFHLRIEH
ncbi:MULTISPECIES: aldehyde dehydrogenase family protein [Bradyrhizobium]|uniref:aldehyde dehydrogenase family protein n=1 Tax=Bradyrhizobium TaxID=374 RepID=UPI001B8A4F97|nr:aldehyde dehydrogenase family protein [Bradyrhizobium sp. Bra78]MBR0971363.1 aldehyde dehydrogenase family protein [Bradyrhizobium japonicum]